MGQEPSRVPLVAVVATLLVCTLTDVGLACSGPGSGEVIEHNRSIVNAYGVVAIFLFFATVAVYFVRGRRGILAILLSLIVGFLHPFWHYGGGSPDCGESLVQGAKHLTIILAGILIVQAVLWQVQRRRIIGQRT